MRDYYYILGIPYSANEAEIRTAYRKLSFKFHPDKNAGEKYFEERFKEIQEAYETLINSSKRRDYDINLNQFRSSRSNREDLKRREEELRHKFEEEFKKREEEIKIKYQEREDIIKEEAEQFKKQPGEKGNYIWISILILIILVGGIFLYQKNQESKIFEKKLNDAQIKAFMDSIKVADDLKIVHDKYVKDSIKAATLQIMDIIAETEASIRQDQETQIIAPVLTTQQLEKYYEDGKNDPNIQFLRQKINEYLAGELIVNNGIDQIALDSMNSYPREYFESKFFLAFIDDAKYGGKWLQIVFINRPDKAFFVWIYNFRIAGFGDAEWTINAIKMVQNDKQSLDPKFGF